MYVLIAHWHEAKCLFLLKFYTLQPSAAAFIISLPFLSAAVSLWGVLWRPIRSPTEKVSLTEQLCKQEVCNNDKSCKWVASFFHSNPCAEDNKHRPNAVKKKKKKKKKKKGTTRKRPKRGLAERAKRMK